MNSAPLPPFALSRLLRRFIWGVWLLGLLAAGAPSAHAQAVVVPADYAQNVATAKSLAAENSWAKARDQYRAALALAPDAEAKRWCELWLLEAEWRAEPTPGWNEVDLRKKTYEVEFARLLAPYDQCLARDDFWAATMEARTFFRRRWCSGTDSSGYMDVADYFGNAASSSDAAVRYVEYLRKLEPRMKVADEPSKARYRRHLDQAEAVGATAESRAWCALTSAILAESSVGLPRQEVGRSWAHALERSRGTEHEYAARLADELWRLRSRKNEEPSSGKQQQPDGAAVLAHLQALRVEIEGKAPVGGSAEVCTRIRQVEAALNKPMLELEGPSTVNPGKPVRLSFGTANLSSLRATLRALTPEAVAKDSDTVGFRVVREWAISLPDQRPGAWNAATLEVGADLAPGFYRLILDGEGGGFAIHRDLQFTVSELDRAVFVGVDGACQVLVSRAVDERPVADAVVECVRPDESGEISRCSLRTDAEGRFRLPPLDATKFVEARERVVALVGEQPLVFDRSARASFRDCERLTIDLVMDRPIARPGETVNWRLIARERQNGRFVIPDKNTRWIFGAGMNDGMIQTVAPLVFDEFGAANGAFTIPPTARPGDVGVVVGIGSTLDEAEDGPLATIRDALRVDYFVPPAVEAKVELVGDARSLRPGSSVAFRVRALYLSGGPVCGAPVECRMRVHFFAGERRTEFLDQWSEEVAKPIAEVRTDANGCAEYRLQLPPELPSLAMVNVEAKVKPYGMADVEAKSWCTVSPTGFIPDFGEWRKPELARLGEEFSCGGTVLDGLGRPVAFSGRACLLERRWSEVWVRPDGAVVDWSAVPREVRDRVTWNASDDSGWRRVHAAFGAAEVESIPCETRADGQFTLKFRVPRAGVYSVALFSGSVALLPLLESPERGPWIIAADDSNPELEMPSERWAIFAPKEVRPGDPLRMLVALPGGVASGWVSIAGETGIEVQRIEAGRRLAWVEWPNPPRGSCLSTGLHWENGDNFAERIIPLVDPVSRLKVSAEPRNDVARPRDPSVVSLRTCDGSGVPSAAQLSVAVYDEALERVSESSFTREQVAFQSSGLGRRVTAEISNDRVENPTLIRDPRIDGLPYVAAWAPAASDDEEVIVLSPFEVTATESTGYAAATTLAGNRLNTELRDAPPAMTEVGAGTAKPEIEIRRHFAPTAFWAPNIVTDAKGEATVSFKYPDNLTQWRIVAYAVGADGNSFGMAKAFTRTSLPFQARLNLPRCLVAGDTAEAGAALLNRTDAAVNATATLEVSGAASQTGSEPKAPAASAGRPEEISVPAQGEVHAGWAVRAEKPGTAEFTLKAWTATESDGMALTLPVLEDGILQPTAASGRLARGAQSRELSLPLPESLDPTRTAARVQLTGSHAATMLDALPYLVDYPYGCVEQTMSRFLPAVVVKRTLGELGFDAAAVEARILGRETPAEASRRGKTAGLGCLDEVIAKSVARLSEAQCGDGGFGWWPGARQTDFWMTAYVLWGLELARGAGVTVPDGLVDQTRAALMRRPTGNESADTTAWMLAALAAAPAEEREVKSVKKVFADCYEERAKLSATGRACLALAAATLGTPEERAVLVRNLENGAERAASDDLGDTVHWGSTANYWRASDGAAEATALTLLALLELEPQHALVEPAMNWLVLNRRSGRWESTRDTAFAVLALSKFLQVRGEVAEESEVEVLANGTPIGRVTLNRETLLAGPATLVLPAAQLRGGTNQIALRRVRGTGPVYAVALAEAWAAGDTVKPAGHQAEVTRGFVRRKATPTLIGTLRIDPETMANGGAAVAGEEVQAVVTVTVPNELEYVMVEVPKPAGCEPLNALSGWDARIRRVVVDGGALRQAQGAAAETNETEGRPIYREEHDDRSVFFLDRLEAGTWEIRFGMRAVTPGNFRALPVQVEAMYVPEIRANSDARRVRIERRE